MLSRSLSAVAASLLAISVAQAQPSPPSSSRPTAIPAEPAIPAPRDEAYPGTMQLSVDATDTVQRIFRVRQTIPVAPVDAAAGQVVLLLPKWLPGNHAPRGTIDALAGLKISVDGQPVQWVRDPVDVFAFRVPVGSSAASIVAEFQFLSPTATNQGRVEMTDRMLNLQWESVSLYPAGWFTRQIPVQANVRYPAGWQAATALRGTVTGQDVAYAATDYETLVDSPVFAGQFFKAVSLGKDVTLNIVADSAKELEIKPDQLAAHKKLVSEADALFGARHFDHYDFLLAITDDMGSIGLEHHRSSENGVDPGYFTKWDDGPGERNLLPHEYTHSWDGKFRRGADIWTPDYRTPMQDSLLWVYEGQTQFWGYVLGARSGLYTKEQTLDSYARIAALYDTFKGRSWRPMVDTTNDPIISARRPKPWTSWQRSEDYYNEGLLMWVEADAILRTNSGGKRSLDDFARAFFGVRDGDWGTLTYTRDDIVSTLNRIAPHDWAGFLGRHLDATTTEAPKQGFVMNGYELVFDDKPNLATKSAESVNKTVDQRYDLGLVVKSEGEVADVVWDGPAFAAGLSVGATIVAIDGREFSADGLREAITAAKTENRAISLVVKSGKTVRTLMVDYRGGLRYPHLKKTGSGTTGLDRLLQSKTR